MGDTSVPLLPAVRLLLCGTHAISAAILLLSLTARARYCSVRPYLLFAARVFYNLLCPQLVWQLASQQQVSGGSKGRDGWPGACMFGVGPRAGVRPVGVPRRSARWPPTCHTGG